MNWKMNKLRTFAGTALLGSAALALPAHADVLNFDSFAPGAVGFADVLQEKGYKITGESADPEALPGDLVGGIMDGRNPGGCLWMSCPINNSSNYYGGLNDGVMLLERDDHMAFSLMSLDASFVSAREGLGLDIPGVLRIQGFRADHTYGLFDIPLHHNLAQFSFESFSTGAFANEKFIAIAVFGLECNADGDCVGFENNRGQFAVDNLNLSVSAVPEPSGIALLGSGLLMMGAIARRRRNQRFATGAELAV